MEISKKSKKSKNAKKDSTLTLKLTALQKKKKEVARVLTLKHEILFKSSVSYLEYLELRAEIERLNGLKDNFTRRVDKLKQQAK
ncbi:GL18537 [Drosophila persimilis]|uniref:Uncharacterized protein n=2 Tax=pseudoobscura subgroup TaxID=32358 RepID=B5DIP8_DROPS|nr:uncharacterized protein LOC6588678 [Drosophila persimilis]XP_002132788.1 uncharacterized protein LOC6903069 [Drosophila pseudoobscura]XP_017153395.1 uncharacterized protein LOC108162924 [Drosophila miranda]EDW29203.1 GL18537 [Drosophila persimilis]